MSLTRAEAAAMSSTQLQIAIDGRITRLRREWSNQRPGSLADIYDLAVMHAESVIRVYAVDAPIHPDQLSIYDVDLGGGTRLQPQ